MDSGLTGARGRFVLIYAKEALDKEFVTATHQNRDMVACTVLERMLNSPDATQSHVQVGNVQGIDKKRSIIILDVQVKIRLTDSI